MGGYDATTGSWSLPCNISISSANRSGREKMGVVRQMVMGVPVLQLRAKQHCATTCLAGSLQGSLGRAPVGRSRSSPSEYWYSPPFASKHLAKLEHCQSGDVQAQHCRHHAL